MRILIDALNIKRGGGVTVLFRLLNGFSSAGIKVHVILSSEEVHGLLLGEKCVNSITHELKPDLLGQFSAYKYRLVSLAERAREIGVDCIFGFNYFSPCSFPQITYHLNVIPYLDVGERVKTVGLFRAVSFRLFSQMSLRQACLNIFESEHLFELAGKTYKKINNPIVRYIGIDEPTDYDHLYAGELKQQIITLTSGNVHKRNDLLVELHRRLNKNRSPDKHINLKIGGFGKEKEIRSSLSSADNDYIDTVGSISFLGYCTRDELFDELAKSMMFVTFSELESFYMVALEAMIVGCPVVAPNISSITESVGKTGFLFDVGDVNQAQVHVENLFQIDQRCKASQESKAWAARFRQEECVRQLIDSVLAEF